MLVTAAVYCRDLQYDFLLDDVPLILMNETLTSWKNWASLFVSDIVPPQPGVDVVATHYRPFYMLWLMLNYQLFGMVLPWWHLTSILLHLLVTALVYKVGLKILKEPWTAALAALLFAFHPIHAESVSYVSASTDLLAAVFMLAAFLAYARFREQQASAWYLAAAILAAALGMLSKETAAGLPLVLVAYEMLAPHPTVPQNLLRRLIWTIPFFAVVASYTIARTILFGPNLGPGPGISRVDALLDAPLVLLVYLRNLLWPIHLSFFYPVEWSAQWTILKALAAFLVLIATWFLWERYAQKPGVRLLLLWTLVLFVIPVASVSAFRKADWVHDRHMYLVSVPFSLIMAALLTDLRLPRKISIAAASLLAATLLTLTTFQVPKFRDELSIYQSALKVAPRNILLRRRYTAALWNRIQHVQEPSAQRNAALQEFRVNIEILPESPLSHEQYATVLAQVGRDDEAAEQYRKALVLDSGQPTRFRALILFHLAEIDLRQSHLDDAERCAREAVAIDPQVAGFHALFAQILRQQGHQQEADAQLKLEAEIQTQFIRRRSTLRSPQAQSAAPAPRPAEAE